MKKATMIGLGVAAISLGVVLSIGLSSGGSNLPAVDSVDVDQSVPEPPSQPVPPQTTDVAVVDSGDVYQPGDVFTRNSRVYVFVGKKGFGHEHAVEGMLASGRLQLNGAATGELVFDMTSFSADTASARKYIGLKGTSDADTRKKVTANMHSADVLDVRTYPKAKFAVTSVTPLKQASRSGLPQYRINGKFTLHGTTRTVSITATVDAKRSWSHVRGRFAILQSDYGIKPFTKAFGAIGVSDQLTIWGDVWVANKRLVVNRTQ